MGVAVPEPSNAVSGGAVAVKSCHTVFAALVANERPPVVPNVCGVADA